MVNGVICRGKFGAANKPYVEFCRNCSPARGSDLDPPGVTRGRAPGVRQHTSGTLANSACGTRAQGPRVLSRFVRAIAHCATRGRDRAVMNRIRRCRFDNLGANHHDQAGLCGLIRVRCFEGRGMCCADCQGRDDIDLWISLELREVSQRWSLGNAIGIRNRHLSGATTVSERADSRPGAARKASGSQEARFEF